MPAKDIYHDIMREALEKDEWNITHDPYTLKTEEIDYNADLGAEKLIAATKNKEKILVEIKSFIRQSKTYEMHQALGQFNTYFLALLDQEPDRTLFLAIPKEEYDTFFQKTFIQKLIAFYKMNIVVFNPITKTIERWIKHNS